MKSRNVLAFPVIPGVCNMVLEDQYNNWVPEKGCQCGLPKGAPWGLWFYLDFQNEWDLERTTRQENYFSKSCKVGERTSKDKGTKKDGRSSKCLFWFEPDIDTVLNSRMSCLFFWRPTHHCAVIKYKCLVMPKFK